ncbi:MAG: DNA translocase FtsK 4TM domain-containing protein [Phycisphaerae bacterium]|nr:DNA translocase FtsK 4TM domain-containing protein [Phycisphaerae bacterium]
MTRNTDKDGNDAATGAGRYGRFGRYVVILVLVGTTALAWVSLLSYSPTDPPAGWVYPPTDHVDNAAGLVGAHVAYTLRYWLGGGAYMGLLFATIAAFVLVFGGRIDALPWRIGGVALMMVATSAAVYLIAPSMSQDVAAGSAGVVGMTIGELLLSRFAAVGSWLIVLVTLSAGMMLAADNLILRLPTAGRKVWDKRGDLAEALRRRRGVQVAEARGVTGSPRAAAAVPASARRRTPRQDGAPAQKTQAKPAPSRSGKTDTSEKRARLLPFGRGDKDTVKPADGRGAKADAGRASASAAGAGASEYASPSTDLLAEPSGGYIESQEVQAAEKRGVLQQTLNDFNVEARVVGHMTGPVITLFELDLAPGVKVSQVSNLSTDIARALAVPGVRVVSPLPGRDTIGIEVPNMDKEIVRLKELMALAPEAVDAMALPLYLGKDAGGGAIISDLGTMPHMLIAGTTGSGKSVCINSIIVALLMTRRPDDVRFILIDPKMVEMAAFEKIPHLLCPIVNDMRHAEDILEWAATKMDERYELLKEAGVRNLAGFNKLDASKIYERFGAESDEERAKVPTHLAHYVIIVDELADLIMTSSKEVENHIIRIAQKARAVGIHMILATQRPSVNVVTGLIKSNMPCRISFRVASRQESRIVLDQNGADVLLGRGDMLVLEPGTSNLTRAQGTYVDDSEIRGVVKALRRGGEPQYNAELMRLGQAGSARDGAQKRDELFDDAVEIVLGARRGSVSLLQRRLSIGYSRASRIIDQMADAGLLGDYKGSQARECLMTLEDWQSYKASVEADQSGESAADGEPTSS